MFENIKKKAMKKAANTLADELKNYIKDDDNKDKEPPEKDEPMNETPVFDDPAKAGLIILGGVALTAFMIGRASFGRIGNQEVFVVSKKILNNDSTVIFENAKRGTYWLIREDHVFDLLRSAAK